MNTDKTFTVAGTSVLNGVKTFRFSNGALNLRTNMLNHKGHTDVDLHELPKPMTQVQAIAWLMENVRGCKGANVLTRSADKTTKNEVVIQARELLAKRAASAAKRAAKKAA